MARELGITRHALQSNAYRRLLRGVYQPADEPVDIRAWVRAARLILPADAEPFGLTALQLSGLDLGRPLPLTFVTRTQSRCRVSGVKLLRRAGGVRLSRADALAFHCGSLPLLDAVVSMDRALECRVVGRGDVTGLRSNSNPAVAGAAALARPGAESVRETQLRLCLVLAGLPEPALQVELRKGSHFIGDFDMGYEEFKLLIEYEGDQHRTDKRQWAKDIVRYENAERLGYRVVRVTGDLFAKPWSQVLRVHDDLVALGYRGPRPTQTGRWLDAFGKLRRQQSAERGHQQPAA